jgi:hypothetical protein
MRGMKLHKLALFVVVGLSIADAAFAWGRDGHRIIGEIAWHYLTPDARQEVEKLLEDGRYDTLGEVGNWADAYSRLFGTYDDRATDHYVDVDPEANAIDMARDCPEGCVVRAIRDLGAELRDRAAPKWERREALLFLVHFIEDIHQPLHVVHPDMTGGNETHVTLFGRPYRFHRVWDSGLIGRKLEEYERADEPTACRRRPWECGPWERWAHDLRFDIDETDAEAWQEDLAPESWANEVIEPSREITFIVEQGQALGEEYYRAAIPVVEEQLQKAAVRLAAVLNEIYAR